MKIHYVGYSELYDEWCLESEIVVKSLTVQHDTQDGGGAVCVTLPYVFSLYRELALRIKQCLTSSRKSSLIVKIEMPFDKIQYDGGLKLYGQLKCTRQGNTLYTIQQYSDLDNLLGMNWHWRYLNEAGDFCFVNLSTVSFYLRKRKPLVELVSDSLPNSFKYCVLLFFLLCMRMECAKSNPHILLNSFTLLSENVHYHYLIKRNVI